MAIVVRLRDIIAAIETADAEFQAYLDTRSGEVVVVSDQDRLLVEDGDGADLEDCPDWQRDAVDLAFLVEREPDRFLALPGSFERDDWSMMRRFAISIENAQHSEQLLDAIHGRGAFRMFHSTLERLELRDRWFAHRDGEIRQLSRDWLQENGVAFTEDESAALP